MNALHSITPGGPEEPELRDVRIPGPRRGLFAAQLAASARP